MLKVIIILIVYYVIIISTDSKNTSTSEKEYINNGSNFNYAFQVRFNKTDDGSNNVTISQNITLVEVTGVENNSETSTVLNINSSSVVENKYMNGNENKANEFLHQLNGSSTFNTIHTESQNVTASQNKTLPELARLQNSSEKSTILTVNQTSITEKNKNENITKDILRPLNEFNRTNSQNITCLDLIALQNNSKKSSVLHINETSAIQDKSINENKHKTVECWDLINRKSYEIELTPLVTKIILENSSKVGSNLLLTLIGGNFP